MPTPAQIDSYIKALSQRPVPPDACNEYAIGDEDNAIRRANLRLYLRAMASRKPRTLLLLEAPGYRGCRLTGVPVTSRKILLEGLPSLDMFGVQAGFGDVRDAGFERVYGEQSATIVWGALGDLRTLPMIWNAYPFHPHKPNQPLSNRKPRRDELKMGAGYLTRLLEMWAFERVIAVGNVAADMLRREGITHDKLRHPAHGGKNDFVAGLRELLTIGD